MSVPAINIVDLFAGVGGFHYGVKQAAKVFGREAQAILVSELEESCKDTYIQNFNCSVEGDINTVDLSSYKGQADIVTAGFPCQPFSNSGLKKGLSDDRGQFYFRIEEIIKHFNSKSFILENVPGIKSNGGGSFNSQLAVTPQKIGSTMHFLENQLIKLNDYEIKWIELNSSHFGSAQVRRRVYIIGIHKDYCRNLTFKFNEYESKSFRDIAEAPLIKDLELSYNQEQNLRSGLMKKPSLKSGMRRVGQAYTCKGGNVGQGYHADGMVPTLTKVWARFLPIYFPHESEEKPLLEKGEFIPCDNYGNGHFRKASVREVFRLQGFPDNYIPHSKKSTAYEHAGNSVNTTVVKELSLNILRYLLQ